MSKKINFLALQISSGAAHHQDEQCRQLTKVVAYLSSVEESKILSDFTPEEILKVHDQDLFLDLIGERYIKHYFDLVSA